MARIVCDHGKAFISHNFRSSCRTLDEPPWSMMELQELPGEWLVAGRQNRPRPCRRLKCTSEAPRSLACPGRPPLNSLASVIWPG